MLKQLFFLITIQSHDNPLHKFINNGNAIQAKFSSFDVMTSKSFPTVFSCISMTKVPVLCPDIIQWCSCCHNLYRKLYLENSLTDFTLLLLFVRNFIDNLDNKTVCVPVRGDTGMCDATSLVA